MDMQVSNMEDDEVVHQLQVWHCTFQQTFSSIVYLLCFLLVYSNILLNRDSI